MPFSVSSSHGLGEGLLLPSKTVNGLRCDAIMLAVLAHLLRATQEHFQFCRVRGRCAVPDRKQILILWVGMLAIGGVVVERYLFHAKLHLRGFKLYAHLCWARYQSFVQIKQLL